MKLLLTNAAVAGLVVMGALNAPQDLGRPFLTLAGQKNCRIVDMCWIKDGKKYCFKKRVCDSN